MVECTFFFTFFILFVSSLKNHKKINDEMQSQFQIVLTISKSMTHSFNTVDRDFSCTDVKHSVFN